jgi:hypothetical protein
MTEEDESMNVENLSKPQTLTEKKKNKQYKQYKDYYKLFPVVFVDPSSMRRLLFYFFIFVLFMIYLFISMEVSILLMQIGKVNLTARMTRQSFQDLNRHAKQALEIFLASPKHDPFLRVCCRIDCFVLVLQN